MTRLASTLVFVALVAVTAALGFEQQDTPRRANPQETMIPRPIEDATWMSGYNAAFHREHVDEAIAIIYEHFMPAGRAAMGDQSPRVFEHRAGEWDITVMFPLPDGPAALAWDVRPSQAAWFGALAKQVGGRGEAEALFERYLSMIKRRERIVMFERHQP